MEMKKIILFGAGRSARHLVSFLVEGAIAGKWNVVVADTNVAHWIDEYGDLEQVEFMAGDASDAAFRQGLIAHSSLVISMLPAFMHAEVVRDCINFHGCRSHSVTGDPIPYIFQLCLGEEGLLHVDLESGTSESLQHFTEFLQVVC